MRYQDNSFWELTKCSETPARSQFQFVYRLLQRLPAAGCSWVHAMLVGPVPICLLSASEVTSSRMPMSTCITCWTSSNMFIVCFRGHQQQDAHEFMHYLLDQFQFIYCLLQRLPAAGCPWVHALLVGPILIYLLSASEVTSSRMPMSSCVICWTSSNLFIVCFRGYQLQDAHEFMRYLLDQF